MANRTRVKKDLKLANTNLDLINNNILIPFRKNKDMKVCDIKDKKTLELFLKIIPSSNIDDNLSKYEEKITEEFFSMKVNTIIFDSRQLGLKVSANSLYGFFRSHK